MSRLCHIVSLWNVGVSFLVQKSRKLDSAALPEVTVSFAMTS